MNILIVYDSYYQHTERMAKVMAEGASSVRGAKVRSIHANDVKVEDFLWADGIALGAPVYRGTMSWQMKKALDQVFGKLWDKPEMAAKVGAVFTTASFGGAGGAELTLLTLAANMAMSGMTLITHPATSPDYSPDGMYWGPVWTTGEGNIKPTEKHLNAFRSHGRRLAETAAKLVAM